MVLLLSGKDSFRALAHGIPDMMRVSPCGSKVIPSNTNKEIGMPEQRWLAGKGASALRIGRAWLGSCCGLLLVAALDRFVVGDYGVPMLIGSFGASAVLLFAAPDSPLSRPRNLLGGHFFSALVGVACAQWLPPFWAICLCVPTAIAVMMLSGTLHPPGGATALIAVTGGEQIRQLGFWYAVVPCLAGAALMLAVAWAMTAVVYRWGNLHGRVIVGEEGDTSAPRILSERENARPVRQDAGCRMA